MSTNISVKIITPEDIRRLRKLAGLTQNELAKLAGVSQSLIARIERKSVDPRLSTVRKIIDAIMSSSEPKTAEDVMHSPVISINHNDTVRKAIDLMKKYGISQMPVLKDSIVIGSVLESTLIDKIVKSSNPKRLLSTFIYNVLDKKFASVNLTTSISDVLTLLSTGEPSILVTIEYKLIGIITKIDVLS
ncbi:MAG: CBS domain-containing protein, partial [Candidatus Bathyarchaeota archaeon]